MTTLRVGSATDVGRVRRNNQDHILTGDTLFAVADGMGGHVAGEVASQVAVDTLRDVFDASQSSPPSGDDLVTAVQEANRAIFERSAADPNLRGMGTTLAAAALVLEDGEERLAVANVGDSRAYVFTHAELTQLTEDHSVAEELVRQGQLDPSDVDTHPQRHILTRALGISPDVEVDLWEVLPYAGDRLMLCSDGLVREVTDDQIGAVLRRLADPAEAAQELVARARAAGGSDNISVVVIDVVDDNDLALTASRALDADGGRHSARPTEVEHESTAGSAGGTFPTPVAPAALPRTRRVTARVVAFIVVLIVVLGGAAAVLGFYARGSYFVTFGSASQLTPGLLAPPGTQPVIIEKGRPGGLLWFEPTLAEITPHNSDEVPVAALPALRSGKVEPSRAAAEQYINDLVAEAASEAPSLGGPTTTIAAPTTIAPPTTATTVPGATTTKP